MPMNGCIPVKQMLYGSKSPTVQLLERKRKSLRHVLTQHSTLTGHDEHVRNTTYPQAECCSHCIEPSSRAAAHPILPPCRPQSTNVVGIV